jgi:serine/threonine protein phosphatase PrpC
MMSRSLGDLNFKPCHVSPEPSVMSLEVQREHDFLIVASDGLWDEVRAGGRAGGHVGVHFECRVWIVTTAR